METSWVLWKKNPHIKLGRFWELKNPQFSGPSSGGRSKAIWWKSGKRTFGRFLLGGFFFPPGGFFVVKKRRVPWMKNWDGNFVSWIWLGSLVISSSLWLEEMMAESDKLERVRTKEIGHITYHGMPNLNTWCLSANWSWVALKTWSWGCARWTYSLARMASARPQRGFPNSHELTSEAW